MADHSSHRRSSRSALDATADGDMPVRCALAHRTPGSCSATGPCTCANLYIPTRSRNAGRHRTQASTTESELGELMETLGHGDYQELDAAGAARTSQVSTSRGCHSHGNHGVRLAQSRRRPSRRTHIPQGQRASLHTHADHARTSRRVGRLALVLICPPPFPPRVVQHPVLGH